MCRPKGTNVNFDLNKGMSRVVRAKTSKSEEQLDHLLRGILQHKDRFAVGGEMSSLHTDVVCFRGLLTTLLATPYEGREGWQIRVARWRGTVYILQVETEQRRVQKERETDRQKVMCSWGFKFETFLTSTEPGGANVSSEPVNENEEFCCMFRTRLGKQNISLVYGAEMDAYQTDKVVASGDNLVPDNFVEMKTSREIEHQRQERNYRRFKLLKWWAQSFLVGTREIVVGWRDDSGLVNRVESLTVRELPRQGVDYWAPSVCVNFLAQFLATLMSLTSGTDGLETVHNISWDPSRGFNVEIETVGQGQHFLPMWYTSQLFR